MNIYEITQAHPNRYVVVMPHERDERGFVTSWKVLNESSVLEEVKQIQESYHAEGLTEAVIYDTSEPEDGSQAALVAEFFRVAYGVGN